MEQAEQLAKLFHETYERLAPAFAYQTNAASAVPWEVVPTNNKQLMIAVCREILQNNRALFAAEPHDETAATNQEEGGD